MAKKHLSEDETRERDAQLAAIDAKLWKLVEAAGPHVSAVDVLTNNPAADEILNEYHDIGGLRPEKAKQRFHRQITRISGERGTKGRRPGPVKSPDSGVSTESPLARPRGRRSSRRHIDGGNRH